jgi:hypothetical protein
MARLSKALKVLNIIAVLSSLSLETIDNILELIRKDKKALMKTESATKLHAMAIHPASGPFARRKISEIEESIHGIWS